MTQARRPIRPPRAPSAPPSTPPRAPRLPPIRLSPVRSRESLELDDTRAGRRGLPMPPFVRWDQFIRDFTWREGEHVTTIGPTGQGKTVLNRELLRHAPLKERRGQFVVVLGIKNRDAELYGPFQKMGYTMVRRFDARPDENAHEAHLIYAPKSDKQGREGLAERAKLFRHALHEVEAAGGWTVYADDVSFMAKEMGLRPEFQILWKIARSESVELVVSSQEPIEIPVMAYSAATHLFLFKNLDDYRAKRMGELAGANREVARETILRLPDHEFLYINRTSGMMVRSRVIR